jgi:DNA replication protein DnaC
LAITVNTPFSHWGEVFFNPAMTIAMVFLLLHFSTILHLNVEGYRRRAAQAMATPASSSQASNVLNS